MTPPQYRAQCRKIRELLKTNKPQARLIAAELLKSFRDYRFHLSHLATGKITLGTRSMVISTLMEAGYDLSTINHVTPAERELLDARAKLHTAE